MRNISLEISCTKYGGETIARPFSKKSKLNYLWINFIQFVYYMPSWGLSKYIKTCRPLAFTSYKAFLKNKRCLELVSLPHFLHYFSRRIFLFSHSINWQNFIIWLPLIIWFCRLCLKKFSFNVVRKNTSIWGEGFNTDSNSRY